MYQFNIVLRIQVTVNNAILRNKIRCTQIKSENDSYANKEIPDSTNLFKLMILTFLYALWNIRAPIHDQIY